MSGEDGVNTGGRKTRGVLQTWRKFETGRVSVEQLCVGDVRGGGRQTRIGWRHERMTRWIVDVVEWRRHVVTTRSQRSSFRLLAVVRSQLV